MRSNCSFDAPREARVTAIGALYPLPLAGEGGEQTSQSTACRVRVVKPPHLAQAFRVDGRPPHPRPLSPKGARGEEGCSQ